MPKGWEWVRLRNVCDYIHRGKSPKYGNKKKLPILAQKCNQWNGIEVNKCLFAEESTITKYSEDQYVRLDDILINSTGTGTVGRTGIVKEYVFAEYKQFVADSHLTVVRANEIVCADYLYFYLISPQIQQRIEDICSGSTNQIELGTNTICNYLISLPPYKEQLQIVNKIHSVLPAIWDYNKSWLALENLNLELPERIKKSILQEAIQGRLVPQNPEDEPASKLLERIREEKQKMVAEGRLKKLELNDSVIFRGEDNKYYEKIGSETKDISDEIPFDIPENWVWSRFSSVVNFRIGKTPERGNSKYWIEGKIPWVSISDMKDYGIIDSTKESITEAAAQESFKNRISQRGSLLMSFKLTIGRTSILGTDAYHNEAIITIIPYIDNNNGFRNFLKYVLPITSNVGDSKDAIKGKTLNSKSLAQLLLPIPPIEEQIRIVEKYELLLQKLH